MSTSKKFTKKNHKNTAELFKITTKLLFSTLKEDTLETTIYSADYQDLLRKKVETQPLSGSQIAKYL